MSQWPGQAHFDSKLGDIASKKPPISTTLVHQLTGLALKQIKVRASYWRRGRTPAYRPSRWQYYKHVVYRIERWIQKTKPAYKLSGFYVIDSICRAQAKGGKVRVCVCVVGLGAATAERAQSGGVYVERFSRRLREVFSDAWRRVSSGDRKRLARLVKLWGTCVPCRRPCMHAPVCVCVCVCVQQYGLRGVAPC